MTLCRRSGIETQLQETLIVSEQFFEIYGDAAYERKHWIVMPIQGSNVSFEQYQVNIES